MTITGRPERAVPVRRLREIGSHTAPYGSTAERHRPTPALQDRFVGSRPDRIAMWAVFMAIFLVLVTAASSHAATLV